MAALYAEDGLMTRPTAPDAPIVGREALLAAFLGRPARTSQHVVGNIVVDVESETAASAYSVILLFTGQGRSRRWSAPIATASCSPAKAGVSPSAAAR